MNEIDRSTAQRRLAAEFGRQGWEYDLEVGRAIIDEAISSRSADATALSQAASSEFLAKNKITRGDLAAAVGRAFAHQVVRESSQAAIVGRNATYVINVSGSFTNSNLNIGEGTQVNISSSASKEDLLGAVAVLVAGGLEGGLNKEAATELASVIQARDDVGVDDVATVAAEVIGGDQPDGGRLRAMRDAIAAEVIGGVLSTGIVTAIAEVAPHLPH